MASQVAWTLITVLALLALSGGWWLFSPAQARAGNGHIERLLALTPKNESTELTTEAQRHRGKPDPERSTTTPPSPLSLSASVVNLPVQPTFNGRPLRKARTIRMLVTGYSPDERSCGKSADDITASGYSVWTNGMKLVAADTRLLPFGSVLTVPGYDNGDPVPVLDRGGAIKGRRLDLLFPTHEEARRWGKRWLDVIVWEYAE